MFAPAMMTRWLGRGRGRGGGGGGGGGPGGDAGGVGASATLAPCLTNTGLGPSFWPTWAL